MYASKANLDSQSNSQKLLRLSAHLHKLYTMNPRLHLSLFNHLSLFSNYLLHLKLQINYLFRLRRPTQSHDRLLAPQIHHNIEQSRTSGLLSLRPANRPRRILLILKQFTHTSPVRLLPQRLRILGHRRNALKRVLQPYRIRLPRMLFEKMISVHNPSVSIRFVVRERRLSELQS